MKHINVRTIVAAGLLAGMCLLGPGLNAQEETKEPPPPPKDFVRDFGEGPKWPLLVPGDFSLDPDRVVNIRSEFIFESRLHTDNPHSEKRVWEVEKGSQNGKPILILNQVDAGNLEDEEMFSRQTTWYVEPSTFRWLFRLGADPLSSTQRVIRLTPEKIVNTTIDKNGDVETRELLGDYNVFSYRYYPQMLAAMTNIKDGMKFRLPGYEFWENSVFEDAIVRVRGRIKIIDAHGKEHEAWKVSWVTGSGFITDYYIGDEPPYYFGQEVRHIRIQEGKVSVYRETFVGFQLLR